MKAKATSTTIKETMESLRRRVGRMLGDIEKVIQGAEGAKASAEGIRSELQAILYNEAHEPKVLLNRSTEKRSAATRDSARRRRQRA